MILQDYIRVLRRRWWIIVSLAVLGALAGLIVSALMTPTYYARSTVFIAVVKNKTTGDIQQGNVFAMQRAQTYAELATSADVLGTVVAEVPGSTMTKLQAASTATVREDTGVIDIDVNGNDAQRVAQQANGIAAVLAQKVSALDFPGSASPLVRLEIVTPAPVPEIPLTPQPRNNTLIGLLVGLVAGVGAVVVAHVLDTRIYSVTELPRPASPQLATITSLPPSRRRFGAKSITDVRLEAFRNLRANLLFGSHVRGVIAVSGVTAGTLSADVARQLARVLVEIDQRVVFVETDLSVVDRWTSAPGEKRDAPLGLTDVLTGRSSLADVLRTDSELDQLRVVPTGAVEATSGRLLSTAPMNDLLTDLAQNFDYVICSSAALTERSEAAVISALAGATLVVVEAGVTKRGEYLQAMELLSGVGARSVSVALDGVTSPGALPD